MSIIKPPWIVEEGILGRTLRYQVRNPTEGGERESLGTTLKRGTSLSFMGVAHIYMSRAGPVEIPLRYNIKTMGERTSLDTWETTYWWEYHSGKQSSLTLPDCMNDQAIVDAIMVTMKMENS